VGSNLDLIVIANPSGEYRLGIADVPPRARGGVVYFGNDKVEVHALTDAIRGGQRSFTFTFGAAAAIPFFAGLFASSQSSTVLPALPMRPDFTSDSATSVLTAARERDLLAARSIALTALATDRMDFGSGGSVPRQWLAAVERGWKGQRDGQQIANDASVADVVGCLGRNSQRQRVGRFDAKTGEQGCTEGRRAVAETNRK
jgi:hypothetical protein